jgi:signal transduction histidine kinase
MLVAEAVGEAETLAAPQLRTNGYVWSGAPPGLHVRAEHEKLLLALLKLLGNAVKFTDVRDGVPRRVAVRCT